VSEIVGIIFNGHALTQRTDDLPDCKRRLELNIDRETGIRNRVEGSSSKLILEPKSRRDPFPANVVLKLQVAKFGDPQGQKARIDTM
jgi:hypothetical protein